MRFPDGGDPLREERDTLAGRGRFLKEQLERAEADLTQARARAGRLAAENAELARQFRDLREIAADTGLTRRAQDTAIREYLASTEPEAQS